MQTPVKSKTFCERFCEQFGGGEAEFEMGVFWRCVKPQVLRRVIVTGVNLSVLVEDLELIQAVKNLNSLDEIAMEINLFRYQHPVNGLLRQVFGIRVSGQRLMNLAAELFSESD